MWGVSLRGSSDRRSSRREGQAGEQGRIPDFFTLTPEDLTLVETARGASNRLALGLLLTWARAARQLVSDPTALPVDVIGFVAGQLGVDPGELVDYRRRPATRTQHVAWVCRHLGVRPFNRAEEAPLGAFIRAKALHTGISAALLDAADEWLQREGVLRPAGETTMPAPPGEGPESPRDEPRAPGPPGPPTRATAAPTRSRRRAARHTAPG